MRLLIVVAVLGLAIGRADASLPDPRLYELADAITKHADRDVATLRARLPDPQARCALGAVYATRGDLPRAAIYLERCDDVWHLEAYDGDGWAVERAIRTKLRDAVTRAQRDVRKKLDASELSTLVIDTDPEGVTTEIDALPGESLATPATIWIAAGTHVVRTTFPGVDAAVSTTVTTKPHARSVVVVAPPRKAGASKDGHVDFTEHGDVGDQQSGPPPDVKHPSILPQQYVDGRTSGGERIADPLATMIELAPTHPPAYRIGLRAGGGVFGHDGGSRIGPSLALVAAFQGPWQPVAEPRPFGFSARGDWSRRGGDDAPLDVFALGLGADKILADPDAGWLTAGIALRGELRVPHAAMMPVHTLGVAAAATVELALRRLPIVVGARYEQGLSELAAGAREHAFLLELGFDLRAYHRGD